MKSTVISRSAVLLAASVAVATATAQISIAINVAPPVLPVIEQPFCPDEGYIWTPGYWAYDPEVQYYWVPGDWAEPPQVGLLWTPPYWGYDNGAYVFNDGYWGPTVGFYGGIDYGFGYFGDGYAGGRWDGNIFLYNTEVSRVNAAVIRNTYADRSAVRQPTSAATRASFNGGPNGVQAKASTEQTAAAASAKRVPATSAQTSRQQTASRNQDLQASVNQGKPNATAIEDARKRSEPASGRSGAATPENTTRNGATAGAENRPREPAAASAGQERNEASPAQADRARRERADGSERATEQEEAQENREMKTDREEMNGEPSQRETNAANARARRPISPENREMQRPMPPTANRPPEAARPPARAQAPAAQREARPQAEPEGQPSPRP
ncbi:MAG: hypothetical protein ABI839_08150 [Verrucomicrobiota bacterium]